MALEFQRSIDIENTQALSDTIRQDGTIGSKFYGITFYDKTANIIRLKFNTDLTGEEVTHLDSILGSYSDPVLSNLKIFNYMYPEDVENYNDRTTPPSGHNYTTGLTQRLHRKDTKDKGRLTIREFYATKTGTDPAVLSDLVLKEVYSYTFVPGFGEVVERTITIHWMREDNTWHPDTKTLVKNYTVNVEEQLGESKRSRTAFLDQLKIDTRGVAVPSIIANNQIPQAILDSVGGDTQLGAELVAMDLLVEHQTLFLSFEHEGNPGIITAISSDSTHVWLDNQISGGMTIRDFIVNGLNAYFA